MNKRTCPKSNDIHPEYGCIWCDRRDLAPIGDVGSKGTNCKYCGEMLWLCDYCFNQFNLEHLRRQGWEIHFSS